MSQDSFESDSDFKKSRDVCLDSSKSGWLFVSCSHSGKGKYFQVCLSVRTVVGENMLDIRILEKMTNHIFRNPYTRPEILWSGIIIRTNPETSG